jgi:hypothetical protein
MGPESVSRAGGASPDSIFRDFMCTAIFGITDVVCNLAISDKHNLTQPNLNNLYSHVFASTLEIYPMVRNLFRFKLD